MTFDAFMDLALYHPEYGYSVAHVDVGEDSLTLEVVSDRGKIVAIVQVLNRFGLREVARTGKVFLIRESGVNTKFLKSLEAKV